MRNVFLSYTRADEALAEQLVKDLKSFRNSVWYDQQLAGTAEWWREILGRIQECDLFVWAVSEESIDSVACRREIAYAQKLGKTILPVLVSPSVSVNALPSSVAEIQWVKYFGDAREMLHALFGALAEARPSSPLPSPLPEPPPIPLSHVATLREALSAETLSLDEQTVLLAKLRQAQREPANRRDAMQLIQRLRSRRDVFHAVATDIDSDGIEPPSRSNIDRSNSKEIATPTSGAGNRESGRYSPLAAPYQSPPRRLLILPWLFAFGILDNVLTIYLINGIFKVDSVIVAYFFWGLSFSVFAFLAIATYDSFIGPRLDR